MCFLCQFAISFVEFKNLKRGDKVYLFDRNFNDLIFYKTSRVKLKALEKLKYTIRSIDLEDLRFKCNSTHYGSSFFRLERKIGNNCWRPINKNERLKDSDLVGWRGPIILKSVFKKHKSQIFNYVRENIQD